MLKHILIINAMVGMLVFCGCSKMIVSEDWENGIDTEKWHVYGSPKPFLYEGPETMGIYSLANNGDTMYGSGVILKEPFEIVPNLTISFWSKLHAKGTQHRNFNQHNDVWLTTSPLVNFDDDQKAEQLPMWIRHHAGPKNIEHESGYSIFYGNPKMTIDAEPDFGKWVQFSLKTKADGSIQYYKNGKLVHTTDAGNISYIPKKNVRLVIGGKSAGTVLLIDDFKIEIGGE